MTEPNKTPIDPQIQAEIAKTAFVNAIFNLNDEGFNAIAWMVYQQAKTAGGYTDHEGWLRVRTTAEQLPFIAETQARFDEAYKKADDAPPTRVVERPDIGPDVKGGGAV